MKERYTVRQLRGTAVASLLDRITIDPEQCGGRACIRGMRIRVIDILDLFAAGLSADQILEEMPDLNAEDFAGLTRRYGVELIAEKVETERQVVDILELDITLGQGHLFGEPRPIRDQVLAETAPPPAYVRTAMARKAMGARY